MLTLGRGFLWVSFLDQLCFGYCLPDLDLQCKYFRVHKVALLIDKRFQILALCFPKTHIKPVPESYRYESGRPGMLLLRAVKTVACKMLSVHVFEGVKDHGLWFCSFIPFNFTTQKCGLNLYCPPLSHF